MQKPLKRILAGVALCGLIIVGPLWAKEMSLQELIDAHQYDQAYQMAKGIEASELGDPQFDYLYARAAIETKRYQEAAFALERVLLNNPHWVRARLELGRAYFLLKQYAKAKRTFLAVDLNAVPRNVADNVRIFLDAVEKESKKQSAYFNGYASLMFGVDSNINTGPDGNNFDLGGLGTLVLADENTETDDQFVQFAGRVAWNQPFTKHQTGFLNLQYRQREHADTDAYDAAELTLTAGYKYTTDDYEVRVPVRYTHYKLDHEAYRDSGSLGLDLYFLLNRQHRVSVFGQYAFYKYDETSVRDASAFTAGATWTYIFPNQRTSLFSSVFLGKETPDDGDYDHLGYRLAGLRVGGQYRVTPRLTSYLIAYAQSRRFADDHPLFAETQNDRFYDLSLGMHYRLNAAWSVAAVASSSLNESNIDVSDYRRNTGTLSLTYEF